MVVRRATRKKTAPKKIFSRRAQTGFAAAPDSNFFHCLDYIRLEVDKKDIASKMKSYIKENFSKEDRDILLAAPDWAFTSAYGATASMHWLELNKQFPDRWDPAKSIQLAVSHIKEWGLKKLAEKEDSDKPKTQVSRSPMEIVKERTSDFIGAVEEVLDMFDSKIFVDWENYSVYNELMKIDASYFMAKGVYDYYIPLRDEIQELVEKKTEDLVEAYGHWSVRKRKEYLSIIQSIVNDAERYMASKKAVRKISKPRVKSADKQVEKVNYLKESAEYKVTSINPALIVGARRVYLFNAKQRLITELVCRLSSGFEVKGTTIQGIDVDVSRTVRLRKPMDFLPIVLSKTPNQINKEWNSLTTKPQGTTGRINKDTIILRALDK